MSSVRQTHVTGHYSSSLGQKGALMLMLTYYRRFPCQVRHPVLLVLVLVLVSIVLFLMMSYESNMMLS